MGQALSSTPSYPFTSRDRLSQTFAAKQSQNESDDPTPPLDLVPLRFMAPPNLQPFEQPSATSEPKAPSVVDQNQLVSIGVEIEEEASPSEFSVHKETMVLENPQKLKLPSQVEMDAIKVL